MIAIGNIKNHLRSPKMTLPKIRNKLVENINPTGRNSNAYKTISNSNNTAWPNLYSCNLR